METLVGHISQIVGPVVDVHFNLEKDGAGLPEISEDEIRTIQTVGDLVEYVAKTQN